MTALTRFVGVTVSKSVYGSRTLQKSEHCNKFERY